jgi:hypothetical protein
MGRLCTMTYIHAVGKTNILQFSILAQGFRRLWFQCSISWFESAKLGAQPRL